MKSILSYPESLRDPSKAMNEIFVPGSQIYPCEEGHLANTDPLQEGSVETKYILAFLSAREKH